MPNPGSDDFNEDIDADVASDNGSSFEGEDAILPPDGLTETDRLLLLTARNFVLDSLVVPAWWALDGRFLITPFLHPVRAIPAGPLICIGAAAVVATIEAGIEARLRDSLIRELPPAEDGDIDSLWNVLVIDTKKVLPISLRQAVLICPIVFVLQLILVAADAESSTYAVLSLLYSDALTAVLLPIIVSAMLSAALQCFCQAEKSAAKLIENTFYEDFKSAYSQHGQKLWLDYAKTTTIFYPTAVALLHHYDVSAFANYRNIIPAEVQMGLPVGFFALAPMLFSIVHTAVRQHFMLGFRTAEVCTGIVPGEQIISPPLHYGSVKFLVVLATLLYSLRELLNNYAKHTVFSKVTESVCTSAIVPYLALPALAALIHAVVSWSLKKATPKPSAGPSIFSRSSARSSAVSLGSPAQVKPLLPGSYL